MEDLEVFEMKTFIFIWYLCTSLFTSCVFIVNQVPHLLLQYSVFVNVLQIVCCEKMQCNYVSIHQ